MNGDCCCGGGDCHDQEHGSRRMLTREEKITKLKNYKEELKKEIAAVDEAIEGLTK